MNLEFDIDELEIYRKLGKKHYKCLFCPFVSSSVFFMRNHVRIHALGTEPPHFKCNRSLETFTCRGCQFTTQFLSHFYRHFHAKHYLKRGEASVFSENIYVCEKCSFRTSSFFVFAKHAQRCKVEVKKEDFYLWNCGLYSIFRRYRTRLSEKVYEPSAEKCDLCVCKPATVIKREKKFKCGLCSFYTNRRYSLQRHEYKKHSYHPKAKKFVCDVCNHSTKTSYYLKKHKYEKHSDKTLLDWLKCDMCTFRCKTAKELKEHTVIHESFVRKNRTYKRKKYKVEKKDKIEQELFTCTLCDKNCTYKSEVLLKQHIFFKHTSNQQILQCTMCKYKCKKENTLKKHLRIQHKIGKLYENVNRSGLSKKNEVTWYKCDECNRKCKFSEALRKHQIRQHGRQA